MRFKKKKSLLILTSCMLLSLFVGMSVSNKTSVARAEDSFFTIDFKSGTDAAKDGAQVDVNTAINDITNSKNVVKFSDANNVYLGKSERGLKFGSGSNSGNITFELDKTYNITKIDVTAATYNKKDKSSIVINASSINTFDDANKETYSLPTDNTDFVLKTYTKGCLNAKYIYLGTNTKRANVKSIKVYYNVTSEKELSELNLTGTLAKSDYIEGETFDPAGLNVNAEYIDGSTENVTNDIVWTPSKLTYGTTSVVGTYGNKTVTVDVIVNKKTYTKIENVISILDTEEKSVEVKGKVVGIQNNSTFSLQDETGAILIYCSNSVTSNLKVGGIVAVKGTKTTYKGNPELNSAEILEYFNDETLDIHPIKNADQVCNDGNLGKYVELNNLIVEKKFEQIENSNDKQATLVGQNFVLWYTNADNRFIKGEELAESGKYINITGYIQKSDTTYQIKVNTVTLSEVCKVTFDYNFESKGTYKAVEVLPNSKLTTLPDDPTLTPTEDYEFIFGGWYTSNDDGKTLSEEKFDFENTVITQDITLYAKWNPKSLKTPNILFPNVEPKAGLSFSFSDSTEPYSYTEVKSISEINENDLYIISATNDNGTYYLSDKNGTYRTAVNDIESATKLYFSKGAGNDNYSIMTMTSEGARYISATGERKLEEKVEPDYWMVTFSGEQIEIKKTLNNIDYKIEFNYNNNTNPRFTNYKSNQTPIKLYKVTGGTTYSNFSKVSMRFTYEFNDMDSVQETGMFLTLGDSFTSTEGKIDYNELNNNPKYKKIENNDRKTKFTFALKDIDLSNYSTNVTYIAYAKYENQYYFSKQKTASVISILQEYKKLPDIISFDDGVTLPLSGIANGFLKQIENNNKEVQ